LTTADLHKLPRFVKAQINPFDMSVDGVKIPDSNTYPSTPVRVEDQDLGVATDLNGLKAFACLPMLKNRVVSHVANTAASWTWAAAYGQGTDSSRLSAMTSAFQLVRPVAHGIKISCSAAPTTITGNLHVCVIAASDFGKTTWNFPTSVSDMSNGMFYRKYPLAMFTQQSLTVVNKFIDCTATRYIDPSSDGVDNSGDISFQTNGWAAIIVAVEGAPANTSVLCLETVLHLECIPKATAVDNSSPAAPFNVNILQETSRMAGQIPGAYADQERQGYMEDVLSAVSQGVYRGIDSYIMPAARSAAYNVGVGAMSYLAGRTMSYGLPGITNFRNPSMFERL